MPANTIQVYQGSGEERPLTLADAAGRALVGLTGDEALGCEVWSGDERATLFEPDVEWHDVSAAKVLITFDAGDTANLSPGIYPVLLSVNDKKQRVGFLEILAGPGEQVALPAIGTYDGVLRRGGDWLPRLQGDSHQSRFAEELHEAYLWTVRQVMSRVEALLDREGRGYYGSDPEAVPLLTAVADATGDSVASLRAARLAIVRTAIDDAEGLVPGDDIIIANEHYAVSVVLARTMAGKDDRDALLGMARHHGNRANAILASATFDLDIDGDGVAEVRLLPL